MNDQLANHPAHVGQDVWWYDGGEGQPYAAKVTRLDVGTAVTLAVFHPENHNLQLRFSVKQAGDPSIKEHDRMDNGLWLPIPARKPAEPAKK